MNHSSFSKVVFVLALIATIIGFTAFSQETEKKDSFRKGEGAKNNDTTKSAKRYKYDDNRNSDRVDIELNQLDFEMKHLDEQMKNRDIEINHLDFNEMQKELDKAMKNLDKEKISAEINQAVKSIDWKEINSQVDKSVAKVDRIQIAEVRKQIEKAREQIKKQKFEMAFSAPVIDKNKIRAEAQNAMKNARKSIEKAKEEIQNMRNFTKALQSDGLIEKSKPYKIEVKEGELYINGNKQSKEVSDKYKRFYKKNSFIINTNDGNGTRI